MSNLRFLNTHRTWEDWCGMLLGACSEQQAPPRDSFEQLEDGPLSEKQVAIIEDTSPGMTKACLEKVRAGGINAFPRNTEDCFVMTAPQRWSGLWRAAFEGSQFCADARGKPATECSYELAPPRTWFELNERYEPDGSLYRVDFIGRRTTSPGQFGHMGAFEHHMVVDRMISIRRIEPSRNE